jgi:hypothetical protein
MQTWSLSLIAAYIKVVDDLEERRTGHKLGPELQIVGWRTSIMD